MERQKNKQANAAEGKSRGGLSTKLHAAVDALGNPVRLLFTEGQASEYGQAVALIEGFQTDFMLADKGYDSDAFRETIEVGGDSIVIERDIGVTLSVKPTFLEAEQLKLEIRAEHTSYNRTQ